VRAFSRARLATMNHAPAAPARRPTTISLVSLIGALYFMVSGGPYGLEELIGKVGFGAAIVVLLVTPVVWSVPTALMVGELAAALPEEGGYYAWVRRALGPFWGVQEAWLSMAASVFDMAIYPTLFSLYLGRLLPVPEPWPQLVGAAVIAASAAYNLAGARSVGQGSVAMAALMLAPFGVMAAIALLGGAHAHAHAAPRAATDTDLAGGVLVAMWNFMGWDNASTIAGEVDRPQRTYPIAVLSAVALIAGTYVVVVGAVGFAGVTPAGWDTGAWVDVARSLGGRTLATAVVAGGMISSFGMFNALCLSYSRLPAVLAEDGFLPPALARRSRGGGRVPWVSIVACSVAWTASLGLSFERLVSLDILLYGSSLVLEFVALVVLRVREPELPRPFRVPGGLVGACVLGIGPVLLLGFALIKNMDEQIAGINALLFGTMVASIGPIAYAVARARTRTRASQPAR
jgi:amino acid transporter